MLILFLGVSLWIGAHLLKHLAPELRDQMGRAGIAGLLVLAVILMVIGYRMAEGPFWWGVTPALRGVNNLLVFVAFYLFAASGMKTRVTGWLRHPQLIAVSLWAGAHLLVNGDLPSLLLFGGLLVWALAEIVIINRTSPAWQPPTGPFPARKEVMALAGAALVMLIVGLIHRWLGYNPFA